MAAGVGDPDSPLGVARLYGRGREGAGWGDGNGGRGAEKISRR